MRKKQLARLAALGIVIAALAALVAPAAAQSEGQIGGIVYIDKNANGIREEGEEGLGDVEVTFESGGFTTTLNTANNGAFSLDANPATWTVSVAAPAGYTAPKKSVEVSIENPGDAVTNIEFALVAVEEVVLDENGEVLPAGGAPISGTAVIGGLVGVMLIGIALVVAGQTRSKNTPSQ
jgi:hypothetical protein